MVETKYGIIITTHYKLAEYGVAALMLTQGKRLFVDFNLLDNPRLEQRYRFTLAEELAHHVIHRNIYKDCASVEERIEREKQFTRQEVYYMETNAKALASAILMPKSIIEARVDELFSAVGGNPKYTTSIMNALSRDFDVSVPAVKRRLLNLGYHNRSNLRLKDT